eukprot:CAMPEP_0204194362 /NCGR_PEP_ID=MMETSP0361-20130328/62328_1 /ASSEMBLY_ACC=CAM_ASM_000343 /TAXON_ID=268821 /ORGANISM="Scrippsiella Hangoei, Strain SHTV-5" /LENGTH=31 /DNA_ID= /DNA_START= /DNA_END= /DNA_ORIENTATION=
MMERLHASSRSARPMDRNAASGMSCNKSAMA